jgi:hypothetical protein
MALTRTQLADPNCEITNSDYDDILSAIMESSRGRWFLSEYARRNRHADTRVLLSAISNITKTLDVYKRASNPYLITTTISFEDYVNQPGMPQDPFRRSKVVSRRNNKEGAPEIASGDVISVARSNDIPNDSDQHKSGPLCNESDVFHFNTLKKFDT